VNDGISLQYIEARQQTTDVSNPLDNTLVEQNVRFDDFRPVLLARPDSRIQQNLRTREPSVHVVDAQDERGGNHSRSGPRLEPIGRASGVEVGGGTGYGGQRMTAVKCLGNVNWHLLLGLQEVIVMKERQCTDAGE